MRSVAKDHFTGGESNVAEILLNSIWKIRNFLFFIFFTIALVALILPGSFLSGNTRSVYYLWESGHLFLFFLGCHLFYTCCPRIQHFPFIRQTVLLLGITFFCVLLLEGLQSFVSGKPLSFTDIIGDFAGSLLFLSVHSLRNKRKDWLLYAVAVLLTGFVLWPVLRSFTDEMVAGYQFPLLADFETPFEQSRFEGKTGRGARSSEEAFHGRHSLRLTFFPGPWSGMTLKYFPSDWQGYSQLHFAVYSPDRQPVSLHVSIRDIHHEQGSKSYSDRYSRMILLPAGWTRIRIPIADIQEGPLSRQMDLSQISGLGFFVVGETKAMTLSLDAIWLE